MEKSHIVPKIYGYVVCLVTIIVMLISLVNIVNALFNLKDPAHVNDFGIGLPSSNTADISSFEAYKASYNRFNGAPTDTTKTTSTTLSDQDLRNQYNAERDSHIAAVQNHSERDIVVYGLLLLVSIGLFIGHWRWVNRLGR